MEIEPVEQVFTTRTKAESFLQLQHTEDIGASYNNIYSSGGIPEDLYSFRLWLNELINLRAGQRILDISSGRGILVEHFRESGAQPFGIDLSFEACHQATHRTGYRFACARGEHLPFASHTFDTAVNIGSLEHFSDMAAGVAEMARVIKPGGTALILVPNTFGLLWPVYHAMKTGEVSDDGQPLQRYGTRQQWQRLLENNGLEVKRVCGYEFQCPIPRTMPDFFSYFKSWRRMLKRFVLLPFIPTNLQSLFIFVCTPTTGHTR